jgi:hypothetical protein
MSGAGAGGAATSPGEGRWARLPRWLRPRAPEPVHGPYGGPERGQTGGSRSSELWLIETTLLVLVAIVLAVATVNDLARQVHTNQRLIADLRTWRHYTGHDYHNVSIDQETLGANTQREVLCGNTSAGAPGAKTQICLAIWGPVLDGMRTVHGGWYLPPYVEDVRAKRYGCFGSGAEGICPR